jgi:hypothetical protein
LKYELHHSTSLLVKQELSMGQHGLPPGRQDSSISTDSADADDNTSYDDTNTTTDTVQDPIGDVDLVDNNFHFIM